MNHRFHSLFKIVFTLLLFVLSFEDIILAQTNSSSDTVKYTLPEITVYGEPIKTTESVLNQDQIEALKPEKTSEALIFLPGVARAPETPAGEEIMIRGINQSRINIFFNGIPIRSNTENFVPLDGLFFSNADLVVVEKGAPSLIYGANSAGNVLHIYNSPLSQKSFELAISSYGGNNGKQGHQLNVSGHSGRFHYNFSGSYYSRNSFRLSKKFEFIPSQTSRDRVNSDQKNIEIMGMITPLFSNNHVYSLMGAFNSSEYGRPPSTFSQKYRRMDSWQNSFIGINGVSSFAHNIKMKNIIYYTSLKDTLNRYTDDSYTKIRGIDHWNDETVGGRTILTKTFNAENKVNFSADVKRDIHRQYRFNTSRQYRLPKSHIKTTTSIFTFEIENKSLNNFTLLSGISYNALRPNFINEESGVERKDFSAFNYQILATYSPEKSHYKIHGGFSSTTIFPTVMKIFGDALRSDDSYTVLPNPDLKEEKSRNFDGGVRFNLSGTGLKFDISVFYNQIKDLIQDVRLSDTTEQAINIESARNLGMDLMAQYNINNKVMTLLTYSYLSAKNTSSDRDSDYLAYRPEHRFKFFLSYSLHKYFGTDFTLTYLSNRYYNLYGTWNDLDPYWLIDASLNSEIYRGITLFAKLKNLLDENYTSPFDYPQPGREFLIGLKLIF